MAPRLRAPLLICAAAAAAGLAACGSSSSTSSTASTTPAATAPAPSTSTPTKTTPAPAGSTTALSVAANPTGQLAFVQKTLTAKAGKVTINFTNAAVVPHDLALGQGSKQLGVTPVFSGGGTKSVTLTLTKGTYQYYCTVPGHRQAGMEGALTVS